MSSSEGQNTLEDDQLFGALETESSDGGLRIDSSTSELPVGKKGFLKTPWGKTVAGVGGVVLGVLILSFMMPSTTPVSEGAASVGNKAPLEPVVEQEVSDPKHQLESQKAQLVKQVNESQVPVVDLMQETSKEASPQHAKVVSPAPSHTIDEMKGLKGQMADVLENQKNVGASVQQLEAGRRDDLAKLAAQDAINKDLVTRIGSLTADITSLRGQLGELMAKLKSKAASSNGPVASKDYLAYYSKTLSMVSLLDGVMIVQKAGDADPMTFKAGDSVKHLGTIGRVDTYGCITFLGGARLQINNAFCNK